jgi:hypothetical protein
MCTVTYLPHEEGYFLTSNRDEKSTRKKAIPPAIVDFPTGSLLYPKDADANGTWMALHERGEAIVLLNGAFEAHISEPPYAKSRGLVLLELFEYSSALYGFENYRLNNIEPFTLVICSGQFLYEARWDGSKNHIQQLDENQPAIWSSSTLYNKSIRKKREVWFQEWLKQSPVLSFDSVVNFHQFAGNGDSANDLIMNRNNEHFTVSITSVCKREQRLNMIYKDLSCNETFENGLFIRTSIEANA